MFVIFDEESSTGSAAANQSLTSIEKRVAAQYFRDIFHFFEPQMRYDGTMVGSVDLMINHLRGVAAMFPHLGEQAIAHLNFVLVEVILQMILRLPSVAHTNAGLFRVLLELSKSDSTVATALGLATVILFQVVVDMDTFVWRELANWLSFHLLNTKMQWPYWDFFVSEYNEAEPNSSVRGFCAWLVEKCGRSAVAESFRAAIPEGFHSLLPGDNTPICTYIAETSALHPSTVVGAGDVDARSDANAVTAGAAAESTHEVSAVEQEALDAAKDELAAHGKSANSMSVTGASLTADDAFSTALGMLEIRVAVDALDEWFDEIAETVDFSSHVINFSNSIL